MLAVGSTKKASEWSATLRACFAVQVWVFISMLVYFLTDLCFQDNQKMISTRSASSNRQHQIVKPYLLSSKFKKLSYFGKLLNYLPNVANLSIFKSVDIKGHWTNLRSKRGRTPLFCAFTCVNIPTKSFEKVTY